MAAIAKPEETNVVVLGSWNPGILQPRWLAAEVFHGDAANTPVQVEFSLTAGQPPRFVMEGIKFVPAFDKLLLIPQGLEDGQLADCEAKLRIILTALPHTPVTAFGINFEFLDEEPSKALVGLFAERESLAETANLAFETQSTASVRAMEMNGYILNFTRTLSSKNTVAYKFNFHYKVADTVAAAAQLNGAMTANLITARRIVAVYDALN